MFISMMMLLTTASRAQEVPHAIFSHAYWGIGATSLLVDQNIYAGFNGFIGYRVSGRFAAVLAEASLEGNESFDHRALARAGGWYIGGHAYLAPNSISSPYIGVKAGQTNSSYSAYSGSGSEIVGYIGLEGPRNEQGRLFLELDLSAPRYTMGQPEYWMPRATVRIGITLIKSGASGGSSTSGSSSSGGGSSSGRSSSPPTPPQATRPSMPTVDVPQRPTATVNRDDCSIDIDTPILFGDNETAYLPESQAVLAAVAEQILTTDGIQRVVVLGHTDERGDRSYNATLSRERVESVVAGLVELGVSESMLRARGLGEAQPLHPDATTDEEHAANRRVEFRVFWEDGPCDRRQ